MADGTKAVVDTSAADGAADEAALAAAVDELADGTARATAAGSTAEKDGPGGRTDSGADAGAKSTDGEARAVPSAAPAATTTAPAATTTAPPAPAAPAAPAAGEATSETTAPLSVSEIAAELASGDAAAGRTAPGPAATAPAKRPPRDPQPTHDPRDTATLPQTLPAPQRRSGDMIGHRYRLEECISSTETFSSWRAVDEKLRRAVGVHLMASGHQRARKVLAAAKSAALLGDPRFVQVLDAVQEGELVYVVREWLPHASDLAKLLSDGPLEPHEAYQMVRQVTDAVAAAHRRGQAHLRLTPRCVLRTDSGQYRINGIAVDAALRGLTGEGSGEDAERVDTRAIGALLFAALTHRWPYPEDRYDLQGLPRNLRDVAPDQVRAGVHKGLSELAARALLDHPPHHAEPITTPDGLARAIALMPRIRQPQPELPAFPSPPRHNTHALPTAPNPTRVVAAPGTAPAPVVAPVRRSGRRLRTVVKMTASAVALGAIGVASWQLVDSLRPGSTAVASPQASSTSATPTAHAATHDPAPIPVKEALSYNPLGEKADGAASLPKAIDEDPASEWQTNWYSDAFGSKPGTKEGTGLLLDLGSVQTVSKVTLKWSTATTAELRMPGKSVGNAQTAKPGDFTVLGKKAGTAVEYSLDSPVTTRYLLIWLTNLSKNPDGPNQGKYQAFLGDVKVFG
ncbi:serine/threonine protein kinase [Kitasatospora purpeofusca]|uniref:protein kinase family protein n=1 Tax=Kitasatospora purpeofusca TaxID=67352 RepID=UPI002A5A25F2|nr:serine/threonine protein kinase [Kitasatospora purpeofusca]MDY0812536.1 serine/threonine protein kinase [Kitasatospora purpeofusca]